MIKDFDSKMIIHNIPTMALVGITVYPKTVFHFDVGRQISINALNKAMSGDQKIFLVSQKEMAVEKPTFEDIYSVGTVAKIKQVLRMPGGTLRVLAEGLSRAKIYAALDDREFLRCDVYQIEEEERPATGKRDAAAVRTLRDLFLEYAELAPKLNNDVVAKVFDSNDMGYVTDFIALNIFISHNDKQKVLEELDIRKRCALLTHILIDEIDILVLEQDIQNKVKIQMDKGQRDYYLREQIRVINEELGESEDVVGESRTYIDKIKAIGLAKEIEDKFVKEASRLAKMQPSSPESGVVRTYLDTILELPWKKVTEENDDIAKAAKILEADHYGLEKVKERILEFFAVKTLSGGIKGQIICLVGPPGVGKTSVARSIAKALGRNYARISLGGVRDEADIRGHRRTYIGSMPGRLINAVKQAGSRNPLILIDEIDKLSADYKGDPSSALLEAFDTEQNSAFVDHYIDAPFDLSDVLFICTANYAENIPGPLYDRMEVIELSGYTVEEKMHIAKGHLMPKQLKANGLKGSNLIVPEKAMRAIIEGYTREAGVRSLERELAKLCRKTAKHMLETGKKSLRISPDNMSKYLGNVRFKKKNILEDNDCGVVNGLAWTSVGGEILEVESIAIEGSGKIEVTGNLGDVMKESVRAAMTYIRSRSESLGIAPDFHKTKDIHIHFPEGAVPKDGPSAGITIATSLISALTGKKVSRSIAMTGEITITGRVLAIGGLKEKTMAAYLADVKRVIIPAENVRDLDDIDPTVRDTLEFIPATHMDDVVRAVFSYVQVEESNEEEKERFSVVVPPVRPSATGVRQ
ncbi:MAG: endopeptidase La [Clostridia bacterium]|nr:endopeptidase La [Clostridia bacterium]MBQ2326990.1 endopeptidase La [Clostridia bacterium]